MKILIVGAGGREHAIAWKLVQNKNIEKIYIAPGNAGSELIDIAENVVLRSIREYIEFAKNNNIDLTIVGSEELLVQGIVDEFKKNNLKIFGPDKKAAILEGSKVFSKDFMRKYGIKTADYKVFDNPDEAEKYLKNCEKEKFPIVIKASGLAAGKGVIIAQNLKEAEEAVKEIMIDKKFSSSGNEIVIEEYLEGKEASILSFTDCNVILPLLSAKDHKKIGENETGLNTGGMGVISPNPYVTDEIFEEFKKNIMEPTLRGIREEGMDFEGVIFFGLMITKKQAVLPLMETDLLELLEKAFDKRLSEVKIKWKPLHSCCVVAVAGGYPEKYNKGDIISGIDNIGKNGELIFICGAKKEDDNFVTSGGRVLNIVGFGKTLEEAQNSAYKAIKNINFENMYYRKDIGK